MNSRKNYNTFRVLFFIKRLQTKKTGLTSVLVRITINGENLEINSKIEVDPKRWDAKAGRLEGRSREAVQVNSTIDKLKSLLNERFKYYLERDGIVTPEKLRDVLLGENEENYSLLKLLDKKIKQKELLVGVSICSVTFGRYKRTKEKVSDFIQWHYQKEDLPIKDVQYDFISNFEIYLRSKCNCGHNAAVRYLRYLKQIISDAYNCKYIQTDPFYNFKLTAKKTKKEHLTQRELEFILNKQFTAKRLNEVRDVFIFQCFSGLAYIDVANLKAVDIISDGDGRKYITTQRIKTGVDAFIPLLGIPQMILDKYQDLPDGKLLPIISNQKMNEYLKEIATLCEINKNLTTHCGRHTFATQMLTQGVSIESVSKMLGHTDIKTTQIYAKVLNEKVKMEVDRLGDTFDNLQHAYANTLNR